MMVSWAGELAKAVALCGQEPGGEATRCGGGGRGESGSKTA